MQTLDPIALYPATTGSGSAFRLIQGDSLQLLEDLPDACVDLIFADPPYHLSNGGSTCKSGKRASVDKGAWDSSAGLAADHAFQRRWLEQAQRVLKPSGTLWVSGTQHVIFSIGFALQDLGFHLLNTVTWFKPNGAPNLACRFFTHSTELLIWAAPRLQRPLPHTFHYQEMKRENGGKQMRDLWELPPEGEQGIWRIPTPGKREKLHGAHPTQKPLALLDRVIRAASSPGDVVLDPFCGSGTTGVAAVSLGRRFLGMEFDPAYVELGRARIREAALAAEAESSVACVAAGGLRGYQVREGRGGARPPRRGT